MEPSSRITIRDVAARAGVSVATVSKVINRRYGVAAGTSARVQAVIDDLGYEASLVAQSLRNHHTNVIGILVADLEPFSTELLKGAADAIRGSGFELVVYSAGGHAGDHVGWERRYLSRLSGTLIDGAVLVTPTVVDVNYGAPIVAIDPHTGQSGLPTIDSDNLRGGQLATTHLLELGHRRIAMLTGRPDLQSAQLREQGYRQALHAAGVSASEDLIVVGDYERALRLALETVIPFAFDPAGARGLHATYALHIRGTKPLVYTVDDGTVRMERDGAPVDCHLGVDPIAFLLVTIGVMPLWQAALTLKMRPWGRRPWLATRITKIFPPVPHGGVA